MVFALRVVVIVLLVGLMSIPAVGEQKRGMCALSFDDGYPSWMIIAEILKKKGGYATGYVNNYRLDRGDITAEQLRTLQDVYGWEIGSHTYSHANPEAFALLYGKDKWVQDELSRSVQALSAMGLRVRSMVFPYNKATAELQREVFSQGFSFRANDQQAICAGVRADGSFSGRALDVGNYVPLSMVKKWIDDAYQTNGVLVLYGHQVLPDTEFRSGTVRSVAKTEMIAAEPISPLADPYICLVPDIEKPMHYGIFIKKIEGNKVTISHGDLSRFTAPGATFLIGPCMGMRASDFEAIVSYIAPRLEFRRISDIPKLK